MGSAPPAWSRRESPRWIAKSKPGQLLTNVALVFLSGVVTLAALEGAVRLWAVLATPNLFVLDDDLGWWHRAKVRRTMARDGEVVVETDELGLRGPPHAGPSTRRRILVLGDSLTEGLQVSQADLFSIILERLRPDLAIFNAGVTGYGTVQEILVAQRLEPLVRPDLSLLMVFAANDLTDNMMPFNEGSGPRPWMDADGRFHPLDWGPFQPLLLPLPGKTFLHRYSLAAYVVHRRLIKTLHRDSTSVKRWRSAVSEDGKWRVLAGLIGRLAAGRRLVIVALPTPEDVASEDTAVARRLASIAGGVGAPFVNLQLVLRSHHFQKGDYHWNAAGHEVVAQYLASVLCPLPPHNDAPPWRAFDGAVVNWHVR
jgi:lysophospholipase L1-like esterase